MRSPTIRLTAADYRNVERFLTDSLARRGRWFLLSRVGLLCSGLLLLLGFIGLFSYSSRFDTSAAGAVHTSAILLVLAAVMFFGSAALSKRSVAEIVFASSSSMLLPYELALDDQGVEVHSDGARSRISWTRIEKVEVTHQYALLFIAPGQAVIVPVAAFSDRGDFQSFASAAKAQKAASEA